MISCKMKGNAFRKNFDPILKYLKPFKDKVWVVLVFVFLEQMFRLVSPLVFGNMVDLVTKGENLFTPILQLLVFWVVLDILATWASRSRMEKVAVIAYKASQNLLQSSISHVLRLPMRYHKDKKIGEVIQRITRADQYLYKIIEDGIFYILPNLGGSIVAFGIILWMNWKLAIVYIVFIALYMAVTVYKTNPIIRYQKKSNKLFERIYGDIFDHTSNILNIKSNTAEVYEDIHHQKGFDKGNEYNYNQVLRWTELTKWQNVVKNVSLFFLFGLAVWFVSVGSISIGKFVTLVFYANMLSSNLQWLGGYYKSMQESIVTIVRNEDIFKEEKEDYDNPNNQGLEKCDGLIEFRDVSFAYDKEDVLSEISFSIEPGTMFAIVGRSGEGKSTLVNMISRYILPRKGEVLLDGKNISQIRLEDLRKQIAIVPQETELFNETIANNIRYAKMDATDDEVKQAARLAQADEFISKFPKGYSQMVGERGVKLSVGQKQRVAIARAILRNPKILILDEATSALDSESEHLVQKALEEVMRGRTTFVIAHRLSTIRKADQIIVLEGGKIAEEGNHAELLDKGGIYKKLSEMQNITI